MAIQLNIPSASQHDANITPLGIDLPAAYLKVTMIQWHYQPETNADGQAVKGEIHFTAGLWASQTARQTGAAPLGSQRYILVNPNLTTDILEQCYTGMSSSTFGNISLSTGTKV